MKKLLLCLTVGLFLLCGVAWAGETSTYDSRTGNIQIPRVAVGSNYYEVNLVKGDGWTWSLGEIRDVTSDDIVWANGLTWGNGLAWQKSDDGVLRTFYEADQYCADLTLEGYDDWRVPMLSELKSIRYCSAGTRYYSGTSQILCVDGSDVPVMFPEFSGQVASYWTSDRMSNDNVRTVSFVNGSYHYASTSSSLYVRCVR